MKFSSIGIVLIALIFLSSCSRDYYCTCTYSYTGAGHPPDSEEIIHIKGSKKYAETTCDERNAEYISEEGDTTTVVCSLY